MPAAWGQATRSSTGASVLQSVHTLDPEVSGGLGDALSSFYASLRQLSQNASDPSLRQAAVGSARSLAMAFNRTRQELEDARSGTDARIAADVSEVNDLARSVASLNAQVRAGRASGAEPNDLLDARQKAVDRLAELTGATPVTTSEGDQSVFLAGGAALVTGVHASTLTATADITNGGHLALAVVNGTVTQAVSPGGDIGGLLDARDGALRDAVTSVDQLAWDLAGALNAVHQGGQGLDGSTGNALFDRGAAVAGAAGRLVVSAAVLADSRALATAAVGGGSGDARNALLLVGTEATALTGGLDAGASLSQLTAAFGSATRTLQASADADASMKENLQAMRESTSGVSIDEELIEMQKAQRAYQAISKVIQTSSDMFDTLLQLK
ncbi:MAG: flagellar hook-associated protein FlgK [Anaeromyxobacter sp.]